MARVVEHLRNMIPGMSSQQPRDALDRASSTSSKETVISFSSFSEKSSNKWSSSLKTDPKKVLNPFAIARE